MKKTNQALENIIELFKVAKNVFFRNYKLANKYVSMARKISMKTRTKIPDKYKRNFCKNCYYYLQPGNNCRVRIKNKVRICYCYNCKKYTRNKLD